MSALIFGQCMSAASTPGIDTLFQGFEKRVSGDTMIYHSPLADAGTAMICRATDGKSSISWLTEDVTVPRAAQSVSVIWLAGLGCNIGEEQFTLSANGADVVVFPTADRDSWEQSGPSGARLTFRTLMIDRSRDRFGFLRLTLPAAMVIPGKPLTLKVTGAPARSNAWVMTFAVSLRNTLSATAQPVILHDGEKLAQPLILHIINTGDSTTAVVSVTGMAGEAVNVPHGILYHTLKLTPVTAEQRLDVRITMGHAEESVPVVLKPVHPWKLYLVQHTHTDIGYTRPQTEILAEHLRYIDYALDFCDQTDMYPDDARFRWTCETAWAVREYLKTRPAAQLARLKKRIQEGRIEVTGMLLNWGEVADENALVHSLEAIALCREFGIPVTTAMQDDVNGYGWCLTDYFHDLGIRYVTSGINDTRALKMFKRPTAFWWESPSGKRVLAMRPDHYMTGNAYSVHTGDLDIVERELPAYITQLESAGYPFNAINLQYSGYFTDNSPPSTFSSELIRRWNEKYETPKLRSATVREFLQWLEKEHGSTLPVYRAAWPDWWTDGFGCALRETAAGRQTQADLIVNQGLLSMAQIYGARLPQAVFRQMASVADNLHFYNEHTFGAAESISDPMAINSQLQWAEKSSYVWQAVMQSRLLREAAMGQLQPYLPQAVEPTIVVFNTLNWTRSGLHITYIDNQILPKQTAARILDESGREVARQLVGTRAEGNYWALWLEDVPPLGYRTYRIVAGNKSGAVEPPFLPAGAKLENTFYRLEIDTGKGAIRSCYDRELGRELLDPQRPWQLAQCIYERLGDRRPMEQLRLGEFTRSTLRNVKLKPGDDGPLWQSVRLVGASDGFQGDEGVSCEIRLFKHIKRIDLVFTARKVGVNDPEAMYIAFPFFLPAGRFVFEAQGGLISPGENQLPGTATDWNTVQNFAAIRSPQGQIVLVSEEIPLMEFGGINTGRYQYEAKPATQQIYSWVLNNYWTTNFRSSQEGNMTWTYAMTSSRDTSKELATRFGWGVRIPLVSRVLPAAAQPSPAGSAQSVWPFKPSPLLLVSTRPTEQGIVLHLREVRGEDTSLEFNERAGGWKLEEVNALGGPLQTVNSAHFGAYEAKFVRIWH